MYISILLINNSGMISRVLSKFCFTRVSHLNVTGFSPFYLMLGRQPMLQLMYSFVYEHQILLPPHHIVTFKSSREDWSGHIKLLMMLVKGVRMYRNLQVFTGFHKCLQEQINCIPNVHGHNHSATQQNLPHC